jgi:hypothetical protein
VLDGVGDQRYTLAGLRPGKTWYPLHRRLGGPQGRSRQVRKTSPPPGFDPRTVQPVASRYTDYAIPAPIFGECLHEISLIFFSFSQAVCTTITLLSQIHRLRLLNVSNSASACMSRSHSYFGERYGAQHVAVSSSKAVVFGFYPLRSQGMLWGVCTIWTRTGTTVCAFR